MATCGYSGGGYLPEWIIDHLLNVVVNFHGDICEMITLEPSREGRPIRAVKLGKGTSPDRRGVLFVGGLHARELINPDGLLSFAFNLRESYREKTDLVFGGKTYGSLLVRLLIENMDIFILPLANPDGRKHVLDPQNGDRMWRGNRAPNPDMVDCNGDGQADKAVGVDNNRNFDFLWSSGLDTSSSPCSFSRKYKGPAAFSEPETQNIRKLLDTYPNIVAMIDVHSFGEMIIYPWCDDEHQSDDPGMNFRDPTYDGQRGKKGDVYKEYIPQRHWDWFRSVGAKMRQAIAAVRGRTYSLIPGVDVYPTGGISGTSSDYAYSRHFVDARKRKVFAFALETGPEVLRPDGSVDGLASFQPPYDEATCIMDEMQAACIELCIGVLCGASDLFESLLAARVNATAAPSPTAVKFVSLLRQNEDELWDLVRTDTRLLRQSIVALRRVLPIIESHGNARPRVFSEALIQRADAVLGRLEELGSPQLQQGMQILRQDLPAFAGRTITDGLREIDESKHPA
jgi:murein tripeptide amidase MpaA